MSLLKNIKETLSSQKDLTSLRYKSSKIVFLISALLFITNYFFAGADFYYDISIRFLPFTYVIYLISFFYVLYFLVKDKFVWKASSIYFYLLYIFLGAISLFLLLPIIYWIWKTDFLRSLFSF